MTESNTELPDDALEFAHRLFDGARTGDTALVTSAIDQGVPLELTDEKGNTFLMLSSYHGHTSLVAELIQRGADVNRPNDRGQTPVAGAVFKRHNEIVRLLLTAGADINAGVPSARAAANMFGIDLTELMNGDTDL
ncbi:ankyrin repeat domain-containing protein [Leucobacter salsicius]|uniref:ankyrin repeat domain-containing protein n=1 Tax=Leucobacter salsicius TaxID=664638 RepID=UPI00034CA2F6|nr:ankyrin repeat domain-containing protein [Leucobacter salsicius]